MSILRMREWRKKLRTSIQNMQIQDAVLVDFHRKYIKEASLIMFTMAQWLQCPNFLYQLCTYVNSLIHFLNSSIYIFL